MGRARCMTEEIRNVYKILVGKHEGRHLRRPKRLWQDDVKIDLKETDWKLWTGFTLSHQTWWDSVKWQILHHGNEPSVSLEWSNDLDFMI